jgi:hypothetical protein
MRFGEWIGLDRIFNSPRPTSFLRVDKQQLEVAKRGGQIRKIKNGQEDGRGYTMDTQMMRKGCAASGRVTKTSKGTNSQGTEWMGLETKRRRKTETRQLVPAKDSPGDSWLLAGCWLDGAAGQRKAVRIWAPRQAQSSPGPGKVLRSNKELRQVVKQDDTSLLI